MKIVKRHGLYALLVATIPFVLYAFFKLFVYFETFMVTRKVLEVQRSVGVITRYLHVHKRGYENLETKKIIGSCFVARWNKNKYIITADHVFTGSKAELDTVSLRTFLFRYFGDEFRQLLLLKIPIDTLPIGDSLSFIYYVEFSDVSFKVPQALAIPSSGSDFIVLIPPIGAQQYLPPPLDCEFYDRELYPLDPVIAIGSHHHDPNLITYGYIVNPYIGDIGDIPHILSDVKIVFGSSGGVLISKRSWKVIGMNVLIQIEENSLEVFAISEPMYMLRKVFEELEKNNAL